jgi:hypothetical protein
VGCERNLRQESDIHEAQDRYDKTGARTRKTEYGISKKKGTDERVEKINVCAKDWTMKSF